jgi:hypothetical protein
MPIALAPDDVGAARRELDRLAPAHGRDPRTLSISVMVGAPPGLEDPALDMMPGTEVLARYAEEGADRVVVSVPTLGPDDARRHLDRIAAARR